MAQEVERTKENGLQGSGKEERRYINDERKDNGCTRHKDHNFTQHAYTQGDPKP